MRNHGGRVGDAGCVDCNRLDGPTTNEDVEAVRKAIVISVQSWKVLESLDRLTARITELETALRQIADNEYDDSGDGPNYVTIARAALTDQEPTE